MKRILLLLLIFYYSQVFGADVKVTELPATTTPLSTDLLYIVTDPSGAATSKKVTVGNIAKSANTINGVYNVKDYGVVGDGVTNDTTAWASLISTVPNYSIIILPQGLVSLVTASIDLSGKKGLTFLGTNAGTGSASGFGSPTIKYTGTAGGTMVLCSPCQDMIFDGVFLDANNLADFGFQALYNGSPTYNVQFINTSINRGSSGRTAFIAIDWCGTGTTSNCEQLVVEKSHLVGSGHGSTSIGVRVGHSNSVQNRIEGNTIGAFNKSVDLHGMAEVSRNLFDNNNIDVICVGSEPIEIAFNRTESGRQFLNSASCPAFAHDNRLGSHDATPASAWIDVGSTSSAAVLTFVNNVFSIDDTLTPFAGGSTKLVSINNAYPTAAISSSRVTSMSTFNGGYISMGDGAGIIQEVGGVGGFQGNAVDTSSPATSKYGLKGVVQFAAGGSSNTGVLGQLNGSADGAAVKGTTTGVGTAGGINEAIMVEANLASIVNGTNAYNFYARQPTSVNSFTNVYGLYIGKQKITGVGTGYGVYQADAADSNFFGGPVLLNGLTASRIVATDSNKNLTSTSAGVTASGTTCTITAIENGIITAATCTP